MFVLVDKDKDLSEAKIPIDGGILLVKAKIPNGWKFSCLQKS